MKVLIVCAPQTFGCNTGMYSVDLAAWYFFKKHRPTDTLIFATLYPHKCDFGEYKLECESLIEKPVLYEQVDRIIFWGDFIHAYNYRSAIANQLVKQGYSESIKEAILKIRELLFLSGTYEKWLSKTIVYGGTLLFNDSESYEDREYVNDLRILYGKCRRSWLREPFSAININNMIGEHEYSRHGTDCAQLLGTDFVKRFTGNEETKKQSTTKKIGVFIGRSNFSCENLSELLKRLQNKMGANLSWLDWGGEPFFFDKTADIFSKIPELASRIESADTPFEILQLLKGFDYIISDTYHVCVNAWTMGIPAICVIDDTDEKLGVNSGSILGKRDKRVVFFLSYNSSPYLLYSSEILNQENIESKADDLEKLLLSEKNIRYIISQMKQHAEQMQKKLVEVIE